MKKLENNLKNFIKKQQGNWSIAAKNFNTEQTFYYQHNNIVITASIIKIAIAAAIFEKIDRKILSPKKQIKLINKDKITGTGILKLFKNNPTFSLVDTINLMIILSDNTATNMCLRIIKQKEVNNFLKKMNFRYTRLDEKYFSQDLINDIIFEKKKHSIGHTTAEEIILFLEKLFNYSLLKKESCEAILNMMRNQQVDYRFSRFLPTANNLSDNIEISDFGSKTGEIIYPPMLGNVGFIRNKNKETIGIAVFVEDIPISKYFHFHINHPVNEAVSKTVKYIYDLLK